MGGSLKDLLPEKTEYNIEHFEDLVANKIAIRSYPKEVLVLVRMSRNWASINMIPTISRNGGGTFLALFIPFLLFVHNYLLFKLFHWFIVLDLLSYLKLDSWDGVTYPPVDFGVDDMSMLDRTKDQFVYPAATIISLLPQLAKEDSSKKKNRK